MEYVFAIVGFIGGFFAGQSILSKLLKNKSKEELLQDKALRKYGYITWALAIFFCALFFIMGQQIAADMPQ